MIRSHLLPAGTLAFALAGVAGAQQVNASAIATALSGAYTARATGFNAVAWNPANLGMPGNPGFSLTIAPFQSNGALHPIDISRFAPYGSTIAKSIPRADRLQWLLDVAADSGEHGTADFGVTEFGLSVGSIGFTVSSNAVSDLSLPPDFIEAVFFGNRGRDSTRHDLNFAGTKIRSAGYSTAALSFPIPSLHLVPLPNFTLGATAKAIMGHGVVVGEDPGSTIDTVFNLSVPAIASKDSLHGMNAGKGFGLDLGAAWTIPGFRFGVSLQNVVNTFKWDTTALELAPAIAQFNYNGLKDTIEHHPWSQAPQSLRDRVKAQKFAPVLAGGVAFDWIPTMTISADFRQQVGESIEVGPQTVMSAGAEWRIIPFIPLRGGVSAMTGGYGASGGFGIHVLGLETSAGGYLRHRNGGTESGFAISLLSIR
jgi:hypothetical protein